LVNLQGIAFPGEGSSKTRELDAEVNRLVKEEEEKHHVKVWVAVSTSIEGAIQTQVLNTMNRPEGG